MRIIILLLIWLPCFVQAQVETCDTPKENKVKDVSAISKCTYKVSGKLDKKKPYQMKFKVSATKMRYMVKRNTKKTADSKQINKARESVASVSKLGVSGVSSNSSTEIVKAESLKLNTLSDVEVKNSFKFTTVDKIPTFKKCENKDKEERLKCFNTEMVHHIERNFDYPIEAVLNKVQGEVWIRFIIDQHGNIANIKTLNTSDDKGNVLNDEALRIVAKLPKLVPAEKDGKNVSVKYGFPINFSLEE